MDDIKIKSISIEQMNQVLEMVIFLYKSEHFGIYQDPDFPDSIDIVSRKNNKCAIVGWYQACVDLILSKFVNNNDVLLKSFIKNVVIDNYHPVDLLYPIYLAFKMKEDATINKR